MKIRVRKTIYSIILKINNEIINTAKVVFLNGTLIDITDTSDSSLRQLSNWKVKLDELYDLIENYSDATPKELLNIWIDQFEWEPFNYYKLYFIKQYEIN